MIIYMELNNIKAEENIILTKYIKLNYIRNFILRNFNKINIISKVEDFYLDDYDTEDDDESICSDLEYD